MTFGVADAVTDVLFDLDGTLTDSRPGIVNSLRYALQRFNETAAAPVAPPSSFDFLIGPPLRESFAKLVGPTQVEALLGFYRERYETTGLFENSVFPGIAAAVAALAETNRLFVATSKNEGQARRIVEHYGLAPFFAGVYGAQRDGARANKGELIAYLLNRHAVDPSRAIMIGDREHDAIGAKANGLRTIGVLWGYGSREELAAAGADPLIATPAQIVPTVAALLAERAAAAGGGQAFGRQGVSGTGVRGPLPSSQE